MNLKWLYGIGLLLGIGSAVGLLLGGLLRLPGLLDLSFLLGLLVALIGLTGAGARALRVRPGRAFGVYALPLLLGTLGIWLAAGRPAPHAWSLEALAGLILVVIALSLAYPPPKPEPKSTTQLGGRPRS